MQLGLLEIVDLLLLEDALENGVASLFVHFEDLVSYDAVNTLGWKVIEHATPVVTAVLIPIAYAFIWVFVHVRPLPAQRKLFKESWVLLLNDTDLLLGLLVVYLI